MAIKDHGFKGAGILRLAIYSVLGVLGGYVPVGNAEMFDLTPESDQQDRISYQEGTQGQSLDTLFTAKPAKIKYKFDTMTSANIAKALSASLVRNDNVTAGTVTAEEHIAWRDEEIRLKYENVTDLVLSTPTAGTGTGYTTNSDGYVIGDREITLITGAGTVLAGDTVTFTGDTTLYAIETGITAPGKIVLKVGLKKALAASAVAMTIRAAITTLSATTDYAQDKLHNHFVEVLNTGLIADGGTVLAAYSYKAVSQDTLLGGLTSFKAKLEMNGTNQVTGEGFTILVGKATLTSSSGFGFLGKDFQTAEMSGIANIDDDPLSPSYGYPYVMRSGIVVTQ